MIKFGKIVLRIKEAHSKGQKNIENFKTGLGKLLFDIKKDHNDKELFSVRNGENYEIYDEGKLILHSNKTLARSDFKDLSRRYFNLKFRTIKKKIGGPVCRICFCDDNERDNPLINPCKCSGSMKYIHLMCLRHWLNSKLTTKTLGHLIIYSFKNADCEVCKNPIPGKIR